MGAVGAAVMAVGAAVMTRRRMGAVVMAVGAVVMARRRMGARSAGGAGAGASPLTTRHS